MRLRAKPLEDWLERELQEQIFHSKTGAAVMCGWDRRLCYHTLRSRGSSAGFPDWVIVGRGRVIYVELKTEKAKPSDLQVLYLDELNRAGAEVYLVRPRDLDEFTQKILAKRERPLASLPDCTWMGGRALGELL